MGVTVDVSKVQCCKEQYRMGTWYVRSMNQDKLEVVKQEMARLNIGILRISDIKWTGMHQFTQMTIISTNLGKNPLEENGVAIIVNKRVQNTVLEYNLKSNRKISVCFQGKPFNIIVIQVYAPTGNAEEAQDECFYEDLQDLEITAIKRCPFHYRGLECKSRESSDTCSNRPIWPWSAK